jgi:Flp pilus assembly protein TadD
MLFGYRNDLARERVLALIEELGRVHPLLEVDREAALPRRLATHLDQDVGLSLCAELRQAGAQVRLVSPESPTVREAPRAAPPQRAGLRLLLLVLVLGAAALVHGRVNRQPAANVDTARPRNKPAVQRSMSLKLNTEAIELSEQGNFAAAADRLNTAITNEPREPTLRQNLRAVLNNWAVAELNDGRPEQAISLAEQALALGPDARLYLLLGVAQSRVSAWGRAQTSLEHALEAGANDAQTFIALGKVYRQQGNREGAVEMFQRARDLGVTGSEFDAILARLERELDAEWDYTELPSAHFTISFAAGENYSAARNVQESLEQAYFTVGGKLDFYGSERTPVVLYDEEEFHDITQAPTWMGALYDGRIKLPVHGLDERSALLDRTVRHEYAHAVVSQLTKGRCPVWLNEGVAIWAEEVVEGERLEWARTVVADQELFPLDELAHPFTDLPRERVPVAYAQSYLAVRSLLETDGAPQVRALLTAIGSGMPPPAAFDTILSRSLAEFEGVLLRSLTG